MKRIFIISITLLISLSYGCEEVLEEKNYGQIADNNYWNTELDAVTAIKAAYASTRGGWAGLSFWQFCIEDMGTDISTGGYFAVNDYISYTGWSGTTPDFIDWGLWGHFWSSINYANTTLDNVSNMDIDEAVKNRVLGEAHAIRAMVYFYLLNWFGPVPEVITARETPLEIPRGSKESNYLLIEADLKKAIELLPSKSYLISSGETDYGRVTNGSAWALLARAYQQNGKWTECAAACLEVINSGEYQLEEDYVDIFALENEGYNNSEMIWVLPFIAGTSPAIDANVLLVYLWRASENNDYSKYYEWGGNIRATENFYNSFEDGDTRKDLLFASADAIDDPIMMLKYPPDPATEGAHSGNDYPFIRLADIILTRAEALANLDDIDGAVAEINKVRSRAGLADLNPENFTSVSLLSHILKERKWELYFEGHAKRDMIRMDKEGLIEYIKTQSADWQAVGAERYLILPFPSRALASNPALEQNPGF
jgi:hypothetical protein